MGNLKENHPQNSLFHIKDVNLFSLIPSYKQPLRIFLGENLFCRNKIP